MFSGLEGVSWYGWWGSEDACFAIFRSGELYLTAHQLLKHLGQAVQTHVPILKLIAIHREEMQILYLTTSVRIQLDVLLSKVHWQISSSKLSKPLWDKCKYSLIFWPMFLSAVTKILTLFMKTFIKSREENEKQAEAEKKKLEKEAIKEKSATKKDGVDNDNDLIQQIHRHRTWTNIGLERKTRGFQIDR